MKKTGILHPDLIRVIASMGHTDQLVIADSGLPIPASVPRIDLALAAGVPTFLQTLEAVVRELKVESAVIAQEMVQHSPVIFRATQQTLASVPIQQVPHAAFKAMVAQAKAVVRTGEQTPYANVILQSGVTF